jgi:mono/diheme cytochrome c family protein
MLTEGTGEWGRSGVRVNAVARSSRCRAWSADQDARATRSPVEMSALGRLVEPSGRRDVRSALDRASAITSANLAIDAGVLATNGWVVHGGVPPAHSTNPEPASRPAQQEIPHVEPLQIHRPPPVSHCQRCHRRRRAAAGQTARAADPWPQKPIKLIVGFAPGNITDGLPRLYRSGARRSRHVRGDREQVGRGGQRATTFVATAPPGRLHCSHRASADRRAAARPEMTINLLTDSCTSRWLATATRSSTSPPRCRRRISRVHRAGEGEAGRAELRRRRYRRQQLYLEARKMLAGVDIVGVHYKNGSPRARPVEPRSSASTRRPWSSRTSRRTAAAAMMVGAGTVPMPDVPTAAGQDSQGSLQQLARAACAQGHADAIVQKIYAALAESTDSVVKGIAGLGVYPIVSTPKQFSERRPRHVLLARCAANVRAE